MAGAGLASVLATGPALFAVRATEYVGKPFLWAKFGAVAVALANLAALHGSGAWRGAADEAVAGTASASPSPARFPWPLGSPPSRRGG